MELIADNNAGNIALVVSTEKVYLQTHNEVDSSLQKDKMEEELSYLKGFLSSVEKKLSNERFVQNAKPEIVANEKKKMNDALLKIKTLEESLRNF